jgi:membrane fusion protein (multidrug efflux system)
MKLTRLALATMLFGAVLMPFSCSLKSNQSASTEQKAPAIPVMTLTPQDTILKRDYVAAIKSVRNVEIRSHLRGFLEEIYIDEGRPVRKGQLLFRINDQELRAELAKARAAVGSAEAEAQSIAMEVNRVEILVEKKVVSDAELQLAKAKLNVAQAKVQEARAAADHIAIRLEYTRIRAPFDGMVDRIPLKVGSLIEEGTLLTTISDLEKMYTYFEVSENEYLAISKATRSAENTTGAPVELMLSDGTLYPFQGKIETMTGEFGASTGSIAFRALFPNPQRLLKHGATGKILITKKQDDVLMVPQKAVFEVQDKSFVYVINRENKAQIRSFTPKMRLADFYLVEDGLIAGERVAAEGVQYLQDGVKVEIQNP